MARVDPQTEAVIRDYARGVAMMYGLPQSMIVRMIEKESRFDPDAVNDKTGAAGILQHRPIFVQDMESRFGFKYDPFNPYDSIVATAKFLKAMNARYSRALPDGRPNWDLAAMAFNWGHGNVLSFLSERALKGNAKIPTETFNYVGFVVPEFFRPGARTL